MKTLAFNRSRGMFLTTVLVLGGLVGLYYYRTGRKISSLFSEDIGSKSAGGKKAGSMAKESSASGSMTRKAREIVTSPEEMDRMPAT